MKKISYDDLVALTIFIFFLLLLITANQWGIIETSEARYAEISREMYRSGDWVHPNLLNIHHYHKPPITYWLTAASFTIFGVNAFAARFFLAAAFGIQLFLLFRISLLLFKSKRIAFYSTLTHATLPLVLISVRGLTTDAYLTTFAMLSLYFGINFLETRKVRFLYWMAVVLGLGFMTKGPVIFIVPFLAMAGLLNGYKSPQLNLSQLVIALIIFIAIAFSWFGFLVSEDMRYADYFFFHHFVDRIAHAEEFNRSEPWYYYLLVIPIVTIPWIAFFIPGLLAKKTPEELLSIKRFTFWWFLLPLVIISLAGSKLVLYLLPLSIGFSLVTGYCIAEGKSKQGTSVFIGSIVLLNICLLMISFYSRRFNTDNVLIIFPIVTLVASLGVLFFKPAREVIVFVLSILFAVDLILFSARFFNLNGNDANSLTAVTSYIKQNGLHDREIIVYDELLPSIAFELDKDIVSVYAGDRSLKRETQFETDDRWKNYFIDATDPQGLDVLKLLLSKKSVLVVKKELPQKLKPLLGRNWHHKTIGKWIAYYN